MEQTQSASAPQKSPPPQIQIFTDASTSNHEGRLGAAVAVVDFCNGQSPQICILSKTDATIGMMELEAVILGIKTALSSSQYSIWAYGGKEPEFFINSDSQYVVDCASGRKKVKANQEEWSRFFALAKNLKITFTHVGRNTLELQALCDRIAGEVRAGAQAVYNKYYEFKE